MAVQINVAANQAALTASIQAGVQAYNQKFAQNNPINLSVNQRAFSQPLGRMTGDVKDFEAALAASNARVIAFGASTAVLGGVIRSFKELANVTIDVEKNLADINRVFGLTTSQLQKFSTDLFSVGKQTASSFDDASKAALEFSRQGLKAEEVLIRTKDALTLARVAGISTANSVDALTSTINGFAATGVTTSQILNKLVAVEQDFAVGAGDLAEALSRTGQAAQEAGVSLDQLNALVTAAQQSTARGGAVIGNALKTIFTRLQRTETLDQLEAFNIAVRDVQGNTLPAVTVLQNFAGAYKNLGDAQRAQLSEQVAGVYQVNILKAIVGDLNKSQGVYAGALQRGASATNEAEVATAKLNQTLDALLKQTATSTQQLANNIGKVTFEPLARYGTEQLKSLVESMNEILEGEGIGSTFANGLLKGIRNVIAGPGAIAAFFTLFKLIQNSFTYLAQALPQIAGITTETQNRKNIEQSILQIMQQQGPVSQALAGSMGNQAAQAQLLLQLARQQTAEYQIQSTLAKQLATQLAGQGVRVKGSGGLQATRAGGYIPNATRMAEAVGAQAGGYAPGKVVKSPVGGVMNTAEDVKYVPGFAQPFINPPAGSKAGRAHRQNAISRTGIDPYMFRGFIPNFANTKYFNKNKDTLTLNATEKKPFVIPENQELAAVTDINKDSVYGLQYKIKLAGSYSRFSGAFDKKMLDSKQADTILLFSSLQPDQRKAFIENYKKYVSSKEDFQVKPFTANKKETINFSKQLQGVKSDTLGNLYELYLQKKFNLEKNPNQTAISDLDFVDAEAKIGDFSSANLLSKAIRDNAEKKGIERPYYKNGKYNKINLNDKALTLYTTNASKGFIPNFATPMTTASIPWFKKYSSKYKNTTGDTDLFKMGDFPTYGRGLDHEYAKNGNSAMLSYLHEDFVRSALNIALASKKVIRPADVGFKNKPVSDISNENDFDLLYRIADGSYSMLELKQDFKNVSGSVTGFMNKKLANLEKENPVLAKKVSSMIAVSNRPKFTDPTGRNAGANFSEFEMAAASIVKDKYSNVDPSTSAKLTKVTDGLLRRYEAKKNTTYSGFIPNFAYKQAVMGLEESMSGNKAIFDTKPFPHIRNKSQPTFSSAIADHGGLGNALSDSMRGQKDAGLMSKGYVPNFAAPQNNKGFDIVRFSSLISKSVDDFGKKLSFKIGTVKENILLGLSLMNRSFDPQQIERTAESTAKKIVSSISNAGNILTNSTKTSFADLSKKIESPEFKQKISNLGTTLAFAGPMAAGLLEQSVFGNRKRTDMSATERQVQSGLSTGLTAASTGASIGAAFGPWGAAIGLAAGAAVGLAQSLGAASLSADELAQVADEYKSKTQENISSAQNYIDTLKTLNTSTDPEIIRKASDSLAENFANIKDVNLQEIFKQTGTDVKKLGDVLTRYEKDRKKMQNEAEEDFRAAQAGQAKSAKDLAKLGYTKAKTIKGPGLASDFTFLEFKKETDDKILSDYKETFSDLSSLSDQQVKEFSKLISQQKASGYFDKDAVSTFLKKEGMNEGMAEMLTERFDTLEDTSNIVGNYLIDNLIRLFNKNKQKIETAAVDKSVEDKLNNDFIKFRNELTERLSDNLIAATNAVKNFEFKTSMVNLVSNKLKEINDSIFSSISGNLTELGGILVKTSQLESGRQFQQSQLATLRQQTQRSTSLKNVEARASYLKQSRETIFSSGGVSRSPESAQRITDFLSTSLNKTRKDFQNFASSFSLSDGEAKNLAVSLEENQRAFREKLNDSKNELLLKKQEFDLTELNNKINYQIGLEQFKLEKEKLKITYAQRDATLQLRKDVESYKITSAQDLELKRINIGSEFRYLGLGKRETFASQQTDQKAIFDDEQKIAQKQAILDARKSIIEIATQEANINAQNTNTEAILTLVDAIAGNKILEGQDIMSSNSATQEEKDRGGRIKDQGNEMQARNAALRKSFNERKDTLSYSKLSDLGVTNEMSIEQAMAQLNNSKEGKDQSTVNAIDNTIQDLKTASETLGSSATVYAAKVAQAKADFEQSAGFVNNMAIGFKNLGKEADEMVDQLGRNLPGMFADGLVDGIKAAIRESDNLGSALMGIASKFLDEISTTLMRAGVRNILSGVGFGDLIGGLTGNQKGGYIRAQSGMYISGTGTGDKYPAMLENGEYVLNRRAVMAMGGPAALDTLNFSAAPRFASGGAFSKEFNDISSMENNMTQMGLENDPYYNELNDAAKQKAAEDRAKKLADKQQKAAMIGSLVAAVATVAIGAGMSNMASNAKATKAEGLAAKAQGPVNLTKSEIKAYEGFQKSGMINSYGEYAGPQAQTGFRSFTSKPYYNSNIYGPNPYAPAFKKNGRQTGGLIGSRLSDTIPGYMEGGLYDSPMVKRYGTGMQSGGSPISSTGNSNSTVNNNTNANNSFNFNTSVQRDGSLKMGSNTTSYEQQDVELSKNLNNKIYAAVGEVIRKEKQFGGSLAGVRNQ